MEKRLIATKEMARKAVLFGACRYPKVGTPINRLPQSDLLWAERLLPFKGVKSKTPLWCMSNSGYGDGYGYGYGYGYGSGSGYGYGYGSGYGDGYGSGYGYGYGYGDGSGYGSGYGDGSGYGSGYGDGYGKDLPKELF